jgi:menaquinone-dependent protoporphyrinogen oxidase
LRVLVAYGTRYGATRGIAERIGEVVKGEGHEVEVVKLDKGSRQGVSGFDLVIVGSGIRMGKWTDGALSFLKNNEEELSVKKVALFVSCGDARESDKREEGMENYLVKVAAEYPGIDPVGLGFFGGVFDMSKYGFGLKFIMKAMTKDLKEQGIDLSAPYDFRDWEEIEEWTRDLLI